MLVALLASLPGVAAVGLEVATTIPGQPALDVCPRWTCLVPFAVADNVAVLRTGIYVHDGAGNWTHAPSSPDLTNAVTFATDGNVIAYSLLPNQVRIGTWNGTSYREEQVLAPDRHDGFGMDVAIAGDWLLVTEGTFTAPVTTYPEQWNVWGDWVAPRLENEPVRPYLRSFHRTDTGWQEAPISGLGLGNAHIVHVEMIADQAVVAHTNDAGTCFLDFLELDGVSWHVVTAVSGSNYCAESLAIRHDLVAVGHWPAAPRNTTWRATDVAAHGISLFERERPGWNHLVNIPAPPERPTAWGMQVSWLGDLLATTWVDYQTLEYFVDLLAPMEGWPIVHTGFVEVRMDNDFVAGNPAADPVRIATTDTHLVAGSYWKTPESAYVFQLSNSTGSQATLVRQHVRDPSWLPTSVAVGAGLSALAVLTYLLKTPIASLFTRLIPSSVLRNDVRRWIMDQVTQNPGIHFNRLSEKARKGRGAMRYHLNVLLRDGLIVELREGRNVSYALPSMAGKLDIRVAKHTRSPMGAAVHAALTNEGRSVSLIAAAASATYGATLYHLRQMEKAGLVKLEKRGGELRALLLDAGTRPNTLSRPAQSSGA